MKSNNLKANLIGATGLVGKEILRLLLVDKRFSSVQIYSRRSTGLSDSKLNEKIVDFKEISKWKNQIHADVAISALGTTRAQAGGIDAQYEVDYTYQAEFAKACAENHVGTFILISSMGANSHSRVPYSRMKGELEEYVGTLGFSNLKILRPGPIQGIREKRRISEEILVPVSRFFSKFPGLSDLHPVEARRIAERAVEAVFAGSRYQVLSANEVRLGFSSNSVY